MTYFSLHISRVCRDLHVIRENSGNYKKVKQNQIINIQKYDKLFEEFMLYLW